MKIRIEPAPRIDEIDIQVFEKLENVQLPAEYRAFLREFNGGKPAPHRFEIRSDPVNASAVRHFFGLGKAIPRELHLRGVQRPETLPRDCLPIAEDDCGNLICLSLRQEDRGTVVFWDHEIGAEDEGEPDPVFPIAGSFAAFLDQLEPE